ncbi:MULTISPECIES: hypothetical protein [Bacillus]|uniref:hypothetical protein n=1 Tax=Bacillus TaxID=1386 RepID=UPI00030A7670|nr:MULTISPECIES: hypothetical protein [Bacillus]
MNLTYVVEGEKYTILNNGIPWIVQEAYIPYPGTTLEESAQNHINTIIEEGNKPIQPTLEEQVVELNIAIAELGLAAEQDKIETQLAIAELANIVTGGVE